MLTSLHSYNELRMNVNTREDEHIRSNFTVNYGAIVPAVEDELSPLLDNMEDTKKGISTQTLVSIQGDVQQGNKVPQYIAALSVTLGAFALGNVLAWTAPAGKELEDKLGDNAWAWVSALSPLGAAVVVIFLGYLIDKLGRKNTMLGIVPPFCAGWALIIWANDSAAKYEVGRFITGMMGGAFSLTAPVYTSEIAEKEVRGSLGSYFQLMVTVGILFVYVLGSLVDVFVMSIVCGVVPIVFGIIFFFMPETPFYHLQNNRIEAARKSLQFFRGSRYDVEPELQEMQLAAEERARQKIPLRVAFNSRAAKKGLMISLGLMFFQQLSGVNAVIFFSTSIFEAAGSTIPETTCTIIVGVIQVIATFISTLIVDRLGRRVLLLLSDSVMAICSFLLGAYFYWKNEMQDFGWLPLVSLCIFMVVFSLGYGPIPWMMVAELFAPEIKGIASSLSCLLNWILAFLVTRFFLTLRVNLGEDWTFWMFAAISAIGTVFVYFVVPETKGKTLEEIQRELGGVKETSQPNIATIENQEKK